LTADSNDLYENMIGVLPEGIISTSLQRIKIMFSYKSFESAVNNHLSQRPTISGQ